MEYETLQLAPFLLGIIHSNYHSQVVQYLFKYITQNIRVWKQLASYKLHAVHLVISQEFCVMSFGMSMVLLCCSFAMLIQVPFVLACLCSSWFYPLDLPISFPLIVLKEWMCACVCSQESLLVHIVSFFLVCLLLF